MKTEGRIIGIDVGKKEYFAKAINPDGKVTGWKGSTNPEGRRNLINGLKDNDIISIEAGNLAFILGKEASKMTKARFVFLNTNKLAIIYRSLKKTDREDALKLAKMVQAFEYEDLPTVQPATEEESERRKMIGEHKTLKQSRTRLINSLHAVFEHSGLTDIVKKNLSTRKNREESVKVLQGYEQGEALRLLRRIDLVEMELEELEKLMEETRKGDKEVELLQTISGVGPLTSLAFMAYVGKNRSFSNLSQVSSFIGLVPKMDISCTIEKHGHITKNGNGYLRSLIYQAAWAMIRSRKESFLKGKYEYMVMNGKSKKKAITAVARKLCELMYTIIKNGKPYSPRTFTVPKDMVEELAEQALESAS